MSDAPVDPGPSYREAALKARAGEAPQAPWAEREGCMTLSAERGGIALSCQVDAQSHQILRVRHAGAPTEVQKGLYDALAGCLAGWSIQDAAEHALIRLENLLRDRVRPPTVAGILQPENADPCFGLPQALVRDLYRAYRARTGYVPQANYEDAPASASSEWGTSTLPGKIQRILANVPEICPETGVRRTDIVIRRIDLGRKVTIEVKHPDARIQERYLTRLELDLRSRVDPHIELYLADRADANAKRRKEKTHG